MSQLNKQYRGKNKSTDVLSFCIDDGSRDRQFLGEIYVSVPTARRQAAAYGATLTEENLRLVCHGLLHLMGYDHQEPADARRMKLLEDRYLDRLDSH
jgi:probable rRNA maturation factor